MLDFPDLTADGSFPLGGAVAAVLIVGGWNPWLACGVAALAGAGEKQGITLPESLIKEAADVVK